MGRESYAHKQRFFHEKETDALKIEKEDKPRTKLDLQCQDYKIEKPISGQCLHIAPSC